MGVWDLDIKDIIDYVFQFITIFGIPTLITTMIKQGVQKRQDKKNTDDLIEKSMQAILRDRLLQGYNYYVKKGYCDYDDKENWLNMYEQYHKLGANGVMDSYKEKLLEMPNEA